jgi:hypothetical protein
MCNNLEWRRISISGVDLLVITPMLKWSEYPEVSW